MREHEIIFKWERGEGCIDMVAWIINRNLADTKRLIKDWIRTAVNHDDVMEKVDMVTQMFMTKEIAYRPKGYLSNKTIRKNFDRKIMMLQEEVKKWKK